MRNENICGELHFTNGARDVMLSELIFVLSQGLLNSPLS